MLRFNTEVTAKFTILTNFLPETRAAIAESINDRLKKALTQEELESITVKKFKVTHPQEKVTGRIAVEVTSTLPRANMVYRVVEEAIKQAVQENYNNEVRNNPLHKGRANIL